MAKSILRKIYGGDFLKTTTIIIIVASLWFIVFGVLTFLNKGLSGRMKAFLSGVKDKEAYLKFNGIFNIFTGLIGIILGIADYFLKDNIIAVLIFIFLIVLAAPLQAILGKKFR